MKGEPQVYLWVIVEFYEQLLNGKSKDDSLTGAKLYHISHPSIKILTVAQAQLSVDNLLSYITMEAINLY